MKLYKDIARTLYAYRNGNKTSLGAILQMVADHLPSGSGWDNGTTFDMDHSTPEKLVFYGSYHHMNEGTYDGWTDHTIIVKPSLLSGFNLSVLGPNRNDIKEWLHQVFYDALNEEV